MIAWTDEAIEAANALLNREWAAGIPDDLMRRALDAATEVQGLETIGYRASEKSFERGRLIGRAEALEEAAAILDEESEGGLDPRMERIAAAIRSRKD